MPPIDSIVQPYIENGSILGAAAAILRDGEIAYLGGFGTTSMEENGVSVTPETLFAFGSIGKTICATLIMRLVEQGRVDLDRPVIQYLPGLQFSDRVYGQKVTLRHLLSHTSGLPSAGKDWGPRDPDSLRRFVYEQIPHYTFLAKPGTVHLYSNTAFCIAGHVAEAVTGAYYDELVQEQVFVPLQMRRATYDPSVAITYPVALPHEAGPDGGLRVLHRIAYNVSGNPSGFALGSATDLANLARMYLNRGTFVGQPYLTGESIADMQGLHGSRQIEGHAHPLAHVSQGYGLGFYVGQYRGTRSARHGGVSQSYNCFFDLFPDARAGVILLTNYSDEGRLLELVAALYDHALGLPHEGIVFLDKPARTARPPERKELEHYAGSYLNVESAGLAAFGLGKGGLWLEREGSTLQLVPSGEGRFFAEVSETYRVTVSFSEDSQGNVTHVMISGAPYFPITLDPNFQPDPRLLKGCEGDYRDPSNLSPEEVFRVRAENGVLYIAEGDHEVRGRAISDYAFLSELGLIEFEDGERAGVNVLKWGKATRYHRIEPAGRQTRNL